MTGTSYALPDGGLRLAYGNGIKWSFSLINITLIAIDLYAAWSVVIGAQSINLETAIVLAFFSSLGCIIAIEALFAWHRIDEKGIEKHSVWHRRFFMTWEEVEAIKFDNGNGFTVIGTRGEIRFSQYMTGLPEFSREGQGTHPWGEMDEGRASGRNPIEPKLRLVS